MTQNSISLKYKPSMHGNYFYIELKCALIILILFRSNLESQDAQITVNFGQLRSYIYSIMFAGQAATKL